MNGGKISAEEAESLQERIARSTQLDSLVDADLVIEAIAEVESARRALFAQLDHQLPDGTIIASNTSSIPIAGLASATKRRERVLGIHFLQAAMRSLARDMAAIRDAYRGGPDEDEVTLDVHRRQLHAMRLPDMPELAKVLDEPAWASRARTSAVRRTRPG